MFFYEGVTFMKLEKSNSMCRITKRVIDDFNNLSDRAFMSKYFVRKAVYYRRVKKYGDPYMNAPLAKFAKFLKTLK